MIFFSLQTSTSKKCFKHWEHLWQKLWSVCTSSKYKTFVCLWMCIPAHYDFNKCFKLHIESYWFGKAQTHFSSLVSNTNPLSFQIWWFCILKGLRMQNLTLFHRHIVSCFRWWMYNANSYKNNELHQPFDISAVIDKLCIWELKLHWLYNGNHIIAFSVGNILVL